MGNLRRVLSADHQETKRWLGGHHNAPSVLVRIDVANVDRLSNQWQHRRLPNAGGDFAVLCANTVNLLISRIIEALDTVGFTSPTPQRMPYSVAAISGCGCWGRSSRWSNASTPMVSGNASE